MTRRSSDRARDGRNGRREQQRQEDELQRILWEKDFQSNRLATNLSEVQWDPEIAAIKPETVTLPQKHESNVRCSRPRDDRRWKLEYIGQNDVNWHAPDRSRPGNYHMSVIAEPKALQAAMATISDLAHSSGKGHCIINFQLQDIKPGLYPVRSSATPDLAARGSVSGPAHGRDLTAAPTLQRPFAAPGSAVSTEANLISGPVVHQCVDITGSLSQFPFVLLAPSPNPAQPSKNHDIEVLDNPPDSSNTPRRSVKHETTSDLDIVGIVERQSGLNRRRGRNESEDKEKVEPRSGHPSDSLRERYPSELPGRDIYNGVARRLPRDDVWANYYPDRLSIRYRDSSEKENDEQPISPHRDKNRLSRSTSPVRKGRSRSPAPSAQSTSKDRRHKRNRGSRRDRYRPRD
ncbi:hypothetical protein B0T16DRAFT_459082 [Cercophora newfieldiana]|uniref:Uncharacterized protein n=1 Tax=Cercophora newfieldiana TaxID=92897 RepID=A0AA40CL24_9PEZI|nr:hypothetical protein B0T16DRAFT_459082 [Cercophora newfieldiana]